MKKIAIILFLFGLSLNSYSQIDIIKRKVTVDSLKARNDSIYVRSPMTGGVAKFDTYLNVALDQPIDSLTLSPNIPSPQSAYVGKMFLDSTTNLLGYFLEGDINPNWINVTQNTPVLNNTSDTLKALTPVSADEVTFSTPNPIITVRPCRADSLGLAELFVGIVIEDIPPGKIGKIAGFDFIAQVNTTEWEKGDRLYVKSDTSWLTNERPMAPTYSLFVGTVFIKSATTGIIGVNVQNFTDTDTEANLEGVINGIITQKQAIRDTIISNILYFETFNEEDTVKDLPFMYFGMRYNLNTKTNTGTNGYARVPLVYGTATNAQTNYIYIDYNSGNPQLAVSTTSFPDDGVRLGECNVYDQATHELYGFGSFQRFNNAVDGSNTDGLLSKITKRLRLNGSVYESPGIDPTVSIVVDGANKDSVNVTATAGIIWQFNRQTYSAQTEKRYLWFNSPTGERWINDLNEIDSTESGIPIHTGNTNRYGINVFAIQNSGGFEDFLGVTSPTNIYVSDANAISDIANFAVTNVPNKYSKVAIRLYRLVLRYQTGTGGTITNLLGAGNYQDERGFLLGYGGTGSSTGGLTTNYADTDFTIYNNIDPTKIAQFDAGNITTGTTKTYDFPDKSGELAVIVGDSLNVTGNIIGDTIKSRGRIMIGNGDPLSALHINKGIGDLSTGIILGNNTTGFYYDGLSMILRNSGINSASFLTTGIVGGSNATGKAYLIDESATITNPNHTFRGDENTGLGYNQTGDEGVLIAGGKPIASFKENVTEQFIINPQADYTGTTLAPNLAWGDGDLGFRETSDDILVYSTSNTDIWEFNGNILSSLATGGAAIKANAGGATVPIHFFKGDENTGTSRVADGQLGLVADGVLGIVVTEDSTVHDSIAVFNSGIKFNDGTTQTTAAGVSFGLENQLPIMGTSDFKYTNKFKYDTTKNALTVGFRTGTIGDNSFTQGGESGGENEASGFNSASFGSTTVASGDYSSAFGLFSQATGDYSMAFGRSGTATNTYSTAWGFGADATGFLATAFGLETEANDYAEIVFGRYNVIGTGNQTSWVSTDNIFTIGNGTTGAARANAFQIKKNGNTVIGGTLDVTGGITGGMNVVKAEILYTNTTQTTIITLPADAVIWEIGLEVTTIFNDSGSDLVDIGITGDAPRYVSDAQVHNLIFDMGTTLGVLNIPERQTSSTNITFQYTGLNSDATQGVGYVYIHYTLH
jgi:hypothetical protein